MNRRDFIKSISAATLVVAADPTSLLKDSPKISDVMMTLEAALNKAIKEMQRDFNAWAFSTPKEPNWWYMKYQLADGTWEQGFIPLTAPPRYFGSSGLRLSSRRFPV